MVVTVAKATSVDYYTGGGGVVETSPESYYLDAVAEGEPPGTWSGSGAVLLGLAGTEVTAEDMTAVYSRFINPVTGEAIGRAPDTYRTVAARLAAALAEEPDALPERVAEIRARIERTDRKSPIGWDATFSVAKSVTVAHTAAHRAELAAVRAGDTDRAELFRGIRVGIETAISDANAAMLGYAETLATTRTGGSAGAPTQWMAAPGLTVASFVQHTNRNIDPQLHVHNVILNRVFSADGKVRSLDGTDFLAQRHALGAVADRVLEEGLTAMGFRVELRPDGVSRELTVVPIEVAELFSSRDRQVTDRVAQLLPAAEERAGRELTDHEIYRLKKEATLQTRAGKTSHAPETTTEMVERWWASARAIGADLDDVATGISTHLTEARTDAGTEARAEARADVGTSAASDFAVSDSGATSAGSTGAGDATGEVVSWSPAAVVAEAVAAVGAQYAAWQAADLTLEIARRLPSLGGLDPKSTVALLQDLTAEALAGPLVRQVSGRTDPDAALDDLVAHGGADPGPGQTGQTRPPRVDVTAAAAVAADPFTRPTARLYATTGTLRTEEALRRSAIDRGAHHLAADRVTAWLDEHAPTLGADQRAAVTGLASSNARLAVLVGPAGTGKSYTSATLANAWADLTTEDDTPGRVVGLAVSQVATQVLRDDGITAARNITQWLGHQDRLSDGSHASGDTAWRVQATDVVLVDEASMVSTPDLHRIQSIVTTAGARLILTGDPRQLGAIEAGGVMELLDGHAETYTLTDVRRFTEPWERAASVALRDGDPAALAEYDRHGRLLGYDTPEEAMEGAATAAVADRVDGRTVVVTTATNAHAAQVATRIREQLIGLGLVEADGVLLERDGCTAGVGDLIAARRNDYTLGVTNRRQYTVTDIGEDGSLTVTRAGGPPHADRDQPPARPVTLPAGYVAAHVQLGYASTSHAAQGMSVDAGHNLDPTNIYVPMTRGRLRNTAHVALTPSSAETTTDTAPTVDTPTGGHVKATDRTHRPTARAVLEAGLTTELRNRAATVEAEADTERLSSMTVLAGRHEAVTRQACRERLDRHLDDLTATGTIDEATRARLGADQGTEHLSRLLRAVEQAGHDPHQVLTTAVTARGLTTATSVAQVLSHRITGGEPLPHPTTRPATINRIDRHDHQLDVGQHEIDQLEVDQHDVVGDRADATDNDSGSGSTAPTGGMTTDLPRDIAPAAVAHLTRLTARLDDRRAVLADRTAADPPAWAVTTLGPVPTDATARVDWLARAGTVAGHREATSWEHPDQPIGTMPGLAATERRASHVAAWHALGRPEAGLEASAMTDGQLRIRVRAAQLERAWAPPHADDALRATEIAAEAARQSAALAYAAAENATRTGDHDTASAHLTAAAGHDADHALRTAALEPLTLTVQARSAWAAATAVTLDEGTRSTTELTRRGQAPGTEPDRTTTTDWLHAHHPNPAADTAQDDTTTERAENRARAIAAAAQRSAVDIPDRAGDVDQGAAEETAVHVEDQAEHHEQLVDADDPGAAPDPRSPELAADPAENGWGHPRGSAAAYEVVPTTATLDDLHATAALAALALDRAAQQAHLDQPPTDTADHDDIRHASTSHQRHDSDGAD